MFNSLTNYFYKADFPKAIDPISQESPKSNFGRRFYKGIKYSPLGFIFRLLTLETFGLLYRSFDPLKSDFYSLRARQICFKFLMKKRLSNEYIYATMNIVRNCSFENLKTALEQKKQTAEKVKEKVKELSQEFKLIDKPFKLAFTQGICFGMVFDLAKQMLIDGKSIEELMPMLSKGGRLEAEVLQALYEGVSGEFTIKLSDQLDCLLKIITSSNSTLPSLFIDVRKNGIMNLILTLRSQVNIIKNLLHISPSINIPLNGQSHEPSDLVKNLYEGFFPLTTYKEEKEKDLWNIIVFNVLKNMRFTHYSKHSSFDNHSLQQALISEINQIYDHQKKKATPKQLEIFHSRRDQLIGEVKVALALGIIEGITNPLPNDPAFKLVNAVESVLPETYFHCFAVANFCGLTCEPMDCKLGISAFFADDETYLKGIEAFEPGFYYISIEGKRSHAIALIKEASGKSYLFDPNYGLKKFNNIEEAQIGLKKTLMNYPNVEDGLNIPERPYHNLKIFKVQAASH